MPLKEFSMIWNQFLKTEGSECQNAGGSEMCSFFFVPVVTLALEFFNQLLTGFLQLYHGTFNSPINK